MTEDFARYSHNDLVNEIRILKLENTGLQKDLKLLKERYEYYYSAYDEMGYRYAKLQDEVTELKLNK